MCYIDHRCLGFMDVVRVQHVHACTALITSPQSRVNSRSQGHASIMSGSGATCGRHSMPQGLFAHALPGADGTRNAFGDRFAQEIRAETTNAPALVVSMSQCRSQQCSWSVSPGSCIAIQIFYFEDPVCISVMPQALVRVTSLGGLTSWLGARVRSIMLTIILKRFGPPRSGWT